MDVENTALTKQASISIPDNEFEENNKVTELKEQVTKLKSLLKLAWTGTEKSNDDHGGEEGEC